MKPIKTIHTASLMSLLVAGLMLAGCSALSWKSSPPKAQVKTNIFTTNGSSAVVTMGVMQMKVMRFADEYSSAIAQSADEFSMQIGTAKGRLAGLRWKLGQSTAAFTDATGENPIINALDLLTLVTVSRMVIEDYGVETYGTNALPLLEIHRQMETRAWELANGALTPAQKQEFQAMILEWRRQNPHQRYVGSIRFIEFAAALGKKPQASSSTTSIFSLLLIDPFAGLDPTTAAIEEAQQFGERLMYYGQRMPALLSWQAEVAALELANQSESLQILTNAQQLASAANTLAKVAGQLPQVINDQREAAINQVFDRLASGQTNSIVLMAEARATLDASSEAAKSVNTAIKSLDEFVRYVNPPATNIVTATSTNNHPFNILDYGTAAAQIGAAALDLNTALQTLNQSTTNLSTLRQEAVANAERMVNRAFWLGLVLIVFLLAGAVVAGLCYRRLTRGSVGKVSNAAK